MLRLHFVTDKKLPSFYAFFFEFELGNEGNDMILEKILGSKCFLMENISECKL